MREARLTRQRVAIMRALAIAGGSIEHREGLATRRLHEAIGRTQSMESLKATLKQLEDEGAIERRLAGRRVFRIAATPQAASWLRSKGEWEVANLLDAPAAPVTTPSLGELLERLDIRTSPTPAELRAWGAHTSVLLDRLADLASADDVDVATIDAVLQQTRTVRFRLEVWRSHLADLARAPAPAVPATPHVLHLDDAVVGAAR